MYWIHFFLWRYTCNTYWTTLWSNVSMYCTLIILFFKFFFMKWQKQKFTTIEQSFGTKGQNLVGWYSLCVCWKDNIKIDRKKRSISYGEFQTTKKSVKRSSQNWPLVDDCLDMIMINIWWGKWWSNIIYD